jgi:hypothetical protein
MRKGRKGKRAKRSLAPDGHSGQLILIGWEERSFVAMLLRIEILRGISS